MHARLLLKHTMQQKRQPDGRTNSLEYSSNSCCSGSGDLIAYLSILAAACNPTTAAAVSPLIPQVKSLYRSVLLSDDFGFERANLSSLLGDKFTTVPPWHGWCLQWDSTTTAATTTTATTRRCCCCCCCLWWWRRCINVPGHSVICCMEEFFLVYIPGFRVLEKKHAYLKSSHWISSSASNFSIISIKLSKDSKCGGGVAGVKGSLKLPGGCFKLMMMMNETGCLGEALFIWWPSKVYTQLEVFWKTKTILIKIKKYNKKFSISGKTWQFYFFLIQKNNILHKF